MKKEGSRAVFSFGGWRNSRRKTSAPAQIRSAEQRRHCAQRRRPVNLYCSGFITTEKIPEARYSGWAGYFPIRASRPARSTYFTCTDKG